MRCTKVPTRNTLMAKDTFILLSIILPSHFWYERKWEKNKKERIKKLKKNNPLVL